MQMKRLSFWRMHINILLSSNFTLFHMSTQHWISLSITQSKILIFIFHEYNLLWLVTNNSRLRFPVIHYKTLTRLTSISKLIRTQEQSTTIHLRFVLMFIINACPLSNPTLSSCNSSAITISKVVIVVSGNNTNFLPWTQTGIIW